jgi:hypothetical protein
MERQLLRDGGDEIEVSREFGPTGGWLRIHSIPDDAAILLDALELEGLTRIPFTPFVPFEGDTDDVGQDTVYGAPTGLEILQNEFAMVGIGVTDDPEGARLRVRNMGSGAEVRLRARQLRRLVRLRHRDLSPLVDPSGLTAEAEPDPDQV